MELPEARQDRRPDSPTFGAIALKLPPGSVLGEWGVMTLDRGGHFWPAERVADWDEMATVVDAGT